MAHIYEEIAYQQLVKELSKLLEEVRLIVDDIENPFNYVSISSDNNHEGDNQSTDQKVEKMYVNGIMKDANGNDLSTSKLLDIHSKDPDVKHAKNLKLEKDTRASEEWATNNFKLVDTFKEDRSYQNLSSSHDESAIYVIVATLASKLLGRRHAEEMIKRYYSLGWIRSKVYRGVLEVLRTMPGTDVETNIPTTREYMIVLYALRRASSPSSWQLFRIVRHLIQRVKRIESNGDIRSS